MKVQFACNITQPIKTFNYGAEGKFGVEISVGENYYKNKQEPSATNWWKIVCFDRVAERVVNLPVGTSLLVEGQMQQTPYETTDGKKGTNYQILASNVSAIKFFRNEDYGLAPSNTQVQSPAAPVQHAPIPAAPVVQPQQTVPVAPPPAPAAPVAQPQQAAPMSPPPAPMVQQAPVVSQQPEGFLDAEEFVFG